MTSPRQAVGVVGAHGHIGQLYRAVLESLGGVHVVGIDPVGQQEYEKVDAIDELEAKRFLLWIVCTPTAHHVQALSEILTVDPRARVLIEKPLCHDHDWWIFEALRQSNPHASIYLSDFYASSRVIRNISLLSDEHFPGQKPHTISIEFSKNRLSDEQSGRFVDDHYGAIGYEWFHILSVLRTLLGDDAFERYLTNPPALIRASSDRAVLEVSVVPGLPLVRLFTSTDGSVRHPREQFADETEPDYSRATRTMKSSALRHRIVQMHFEDGLVGARLEPIGEDSAYSPRNLHEITLRHVGLPPSRWTVEDNHMATFVADVVAGRAQPLTGAGGVRRLHQRMELVTRKVREVSKK